MESGRKRTLVVRISIFAAVLLCVGGGGLIYDYSRPAVYRATSRLAVDLPNATDEAARIQFALNEAQAMRHSELMETVVAKLSAGSSGPVMDPHELARRFVVDHVSHTNVIDVRVEGNDRTQLVSALSAWIEAYSRSRKDTDRAEEIAAFEEAKHAARVAQKAVEEKQRAIDAFRQRHGIISSEREENPSTARLRGLHASLNEAAAKEVKAEARLKAVQESLAQGRGTIRNSDKAAIASLEMRAVELRERTKDLEQDYTQHFLASDPKYRALKANLGRIEQQIEQEKERSQKAALVEAQEELLGAQQAVQKIREQANALKSESQAFTTQFVELKRLGDDLEKLQETRRAAFERQAQFETALKPTEVRIRVISFPSASPTPIAPDYSRDAAIALASGLALAIIAVWLHDYLRKEPLEPGGQIAQPIIQIAYPVVQAQPGTPDVRLGSATASLLGSPASVPRELSRPDMAALWATAPRSDRLIIAALFAGIAPAELSQLRWKHVDPESRLIRVPGSSARAILLVEPMRQELLARIDENSAAPASDLPLFADGAGNPVDEPMVDAQLACIAHDAGVRHPEEVTARSLHFTYAAFLARQGMRMMDLTATVGRINGAVGAELMRLAPPHAASPAPECIERTYPGLILHIPHMAGSSGSSTIGGA